MASSISQTQQREPLSGLSPRASAAKTATTEKARESSSRYERLATLTGVQIVSTGSWAPPRRVTNQDLAEWGYDADWIVQRTGIRERRVAPREMATSDVGYEAARRCLDQAGLSPQDIDLIIVATMTPDSPSPSTACRLQHRLGCHAPAFDVNAACAGFMYALTVGMNMTRAGGLRRVLVVGSDVMSRIVDPADKKTFPLFGDGAGAVLLEPGTSRQGLIAYVLGSDGSGGDLLSIPAGGSREPASLDTVADKRHAMRMDGRAVFKWAVRTVHDAAVRVIRHAQLTVDDIALVVLHQANWRILDALAQDLRISPDRMLSNLDRYGNTSAASIPLVLDEAYREGRIQPGDRVLIAGFGAGLAWGAGIMVW